MPMEPEVTPVVEDVGVAKAPEVSDAAPAPATDPFKTPPAVQKYLRRRVELCVQTKRDLVPKWSTNIDYRRGKLSGEDSDDTRNSQAIDWSFTKSKQTQLYSQTPQVTVKPEGGEASPFKPVVPVVQRRLNKRIRDAKVGKAMDQTLPDIINAAGVGAVLVAYDTRTEQRMVPTYDETKLTMFQQLQKKLGLFENPMEEIAVVTDQRFLCTRISPADLIWDTSETSDDFNEHAVVGHTGRLLWAEAQRKFKLDDGEKDKLIGDSRTDQELLVARDAEHRADESVEYDELFYWRYKFVPSETSFKAIQHIVFLRGREAPVIDEPWKGQQRLPDGMLVGSLKRPIQVCTLTYMSDEPIPPSDTAIGRPMVKELLDYRTDQREQRKFNVPARWADVNRVPPEVLENLMEGNWQQIVPVIGDGTRAIGEVARAAYPRENNLLEQSVRQDIQEAWKVGPNQLATMARSGEHSASESNIVESHFATQVGYERSKTTELFLNIVDVLAGLMLLHDNFDLAADLTDQDKARLQGVDLRTINHEAAFYIQPDSTVLLDARDEFQRLDRFLDKTVKSGFINPKPIIERMASLTQLDPADVIVDPKPSSPESPNISFRFSGEDMLGPMAPVILAIMARAGQAPTPEELPGVLALLNAVKMQQAPVPPPADGAVEPSPTGEVPPNPFPSWNMPDTIGKRAAERGVQ